MNIADYINDLTDDQLDYAVQQINKRKASLNEEPVELYIVSDSDCNVGCYTEEEFHKAKVHLIKIISSDDYTSNHVGRPGDSPMITKIKVSQSQAKEYMGLNK